MKKIYKLGVIGCGFMASAIIDGILKSSILKKQDIIISNRSSNKLEKYKNQGIKTTTSNIEVAKNSDFLLFAIKPQNLQFVLDEIKNENVNKIISILAGTKKEKFKKVFPNSKVARCMPNTPCSLGYGATGADVSDFNDEDKKFIQSILQILGEVVFVNESDINTVTGISGSAPAYFYLFLKEIIEVGVKNGLSREDAKLLATQTMIGSGKMVLSSNKSIDELIDAVCSKGGTTIEAVNFFNDSKLKEIVSNAIEKCILRAKEIENL